MKNTEEQRLKTLEEEHRVLKETNVALLEQMKLLVEAVSEQGALLKQIKEQIDENTEDLQEIGGHSAGASGTAEGNTLLIKLVHELAIERHQETQDALKKMDGRLKNIDSRPGGNW